MEITNKVVNPKFTAGPGPAFNSFVTTAWRLTVVMAGLAVFVYFVWGAFEWLTAGGESDKIAKAQKRITNSLIGLIILISIIAILRFIMPLIGLNIFCPLNWQTLKFQCK